MKVEFIRVTFPMHFCHNVFIVVISVTTRRLYLKETEIYPILILYNSYVQFFFFFQIDTSRNLNSHQFDIKTNQLISGRRRNNNHSKRLPERSRKFIVIHIGLAFALSPSSCDFVRISKLEFPVRSLPCDAGRVGRIRE